MSSVWLGMQTSMSVSGRRLYSMRYCVSSGLPLAAAVGDVGLVVDQRFGAQQVGNAGRHIADLGSGGLGMPAGEQRVVAVVRAFLDLEALADFAGQAFVLAQTQQPVERHFVLGGNVEQRFGARQARRGARKQLRQCRAVDPHGRREIRLVLVGALQEQLQPVAKDVREMALVHYPPPIRIRFSLTQREPAFLGTRNPAYVYNL